MGAFSKRASVRIEGREGWDEGEYIEIKGVATAEDMELIMIQEMKPGKDGTLVPTQSMSVTAALERMIIEWQLFGDNQTVVPLYVDGGKRKLKHVQAIRELPTAYVAPVMTAIGEIIGNARVPDPLALPPGVNGPTGETSNVGSPPPASSS